MSFLVPGQVDIAKIATFETILSALSLLDTQLAASEYAQFIVFNKAYGIVTHAIMMASDDNLFKNPKLIERFTVCFSRYYFRAVNGTMSGQKDIPAAWLKLSEHAVLRGPVFNTLILGANAHINHDLPYALLEIMSGKDNDDLLKDVRVIDKLLLRSGKVIITTFKEPNKALNFLKLHVQFLYFYPTMYMILYWRVIAVKNYLFMKINGHESTSFKARSLIIANRFLLISKLLG